MKKVIAIAALLALCIVGFGCVANTFDVEIDKETKAITLTAPTPTNGVVNMEVTVKEGQALAYAVNVESGHFRVKFAHVVDDAEVTAYENNPIESDTEDTVALDPGKYQMVVLAMEGTGRYKVQAYDVAEAKADPSVLTDLLAELKTAVETMPVTE